MIIMNQNIHKLQGVRGEEFLLILVDSTFMAGFKSGFESKHQT
jgi:hypothetical protein